MNINFTKFILQNEILYSRLSKSVQKYLQYLNIIYNNKMHFYIKNNDKKYTYVYLGKTFNKHILLKIDFVSLVEKKYNRIICETVLDEYIEKGLYNEFDKVY